jgi:hypothetical protein
MYRLLIKTHCNTGLKYLCKTVKDDYISYKGSGKYWKQHIKKHGNNIKTEVLYESFSLEDFNRVCLEYSIKYNVAESNEWANLIPETGLDGGNRWDFLDDKTQEQIKISQSKKYKGKIRPKEHCDAISIGRKNMSQKDKEQRKIKLIETRSKRNYNYLWSKMSNERKGSLNPAAKSIEIDGITYGSISDAVELLKLPRHKIDYRLKSDKFPTYRRIN